MQGLLTLYIITFPTHRKSMNSRIFLVSVVAWVALALTPIGSVYAADATSARATGSISGRVQNVATGQYLSKARIAIKGTEQVAFTDEYGAYVLSNVRSGPVVLEVFYTGLDSAEIPLN